MPGTAGHTASDRPVGRVGGDASHSGAAGPGGGEPSDARRPRAAPDEAQPTHAIEPGAEGREWSGRTTVLGVPLRRPAVNRGMNLRASPA